MWSKLVCGKKGNCYFINVPGPFQESKAAMEAFLAAVEDPQSSIDDLSLYMAQAVFKKYPQGAAKLAD